MRHFLLSVYLCTNELRLSVLANVYLGLMNPSSMVMVCLTSV